MNLHEMSDCHLDLMDNKGRERFLINLDNHFKSKPVKTIVLAGDMFALSKEKQTRELLNVFCSTYENVIYIPGNHEYANLSIKEGDKLLNDLAFTFRNCHILGVNGKNEVEIEGKKFSGGMGWYRDCMDYSLKKVWFDYRKVSDMEPEAYNAHANFIEKGMGGDVIITHTFPTTESIAQQWKDSKYNVFFCMYLSNVLDHMTKYPELWIHGHTHDEMSFQSAYGYKVYCNPRGYSHEPAHLKFWDRVFLEIKGKEA